METPQVQSAERVEWRPLIWLLAAQLASLLVFFLGSADGFSNWEELHTPSASLMVLHGYLGDLLGMQYMTFCGGCSVDTLLAVPLVALGGPSLLLWKLLPWSFALVILAAGYWVTHRWAGRPAAVLFGLAMILAPTSYQHLEMVGFSNHVQVMALVWLSVVAWTHALETPGARWPFATGLLAGLSFYYCYTAAFAPPVLLVLYFAWRPRDLFRWRGWALLLGLVPPLAWWAWTQTHMPAKSGLDVPFFGVYQQEAGAMFSLAHVLERLPRLGPVCWRSLFAPSLGEGALLVGASVALVAAVGIAGAVIHGIRGLVRREAQPLDIALPALTLAFIAAYLLVTTGAVAELSQVLHPEYLRYQAPLQSLGAVCAAGTLAWLLRGRARVLAIVLIAALLGPGLTGRLASVQVEQLSLRPLFLHGTTWLTLGNRINVPEYQDLEDIQAFLGGSHRIARRILLGNLADRTGHAFLEGGDSLALRRLASWTGALSEEDQANLLRGLAQQVQDRYQNGAAGDARLLELFDALGPAATCTLRREQIRLDATALADRFAAWDSAPVGAPPLADPPCAAGAGDWGYGYLLMGWGHVASERSFREPITALAGTWRAYAALEPERRADFMEGVGERAGELWGYDPWAHRALRGAIPPGLVPPFEAGFERGARWAFVWPIGI
ncbi:MAG: hypothetical protein ABIO70_16795 [Pseudomonadota bacterium]